MPPKRDCAYMVKACTCRASSRTWFAAYSCAPGSRKMSHRLADRLSAPCSPCSRLEIVQRADSLAKSTFCPSSSLSHIAVCDSTMKLNGSSGSPAGGGVTRSM